MADREKPLALYIFSKDKPMVDRILTNTSSGGVTVNDTLMHPSCELTVDNSFNALIVMLSWYCQLDVGKGVKFTKKSFPNLLWASGLTHMNNTGKLGPVVYP